MKQLMIILALMVVSPAFAQHSDPPMERPRPQRCDEPRKPKFSPEEFRAKMKQYVKKHAHLTDAEADKVMPLYDEMMERKREINDNIRSIKQHLNEKSTDKDAANGLDAIIRLRQDEIAVEKEYYGKMSAVVGARKVMDVIKAADGFHREIFRKNGMGPHGENAKTQRPEGKNHRQGQKKR